MTYTRRSNLRQLSFLQGAITTWYKNDENNHNYNLPEGRWQAKFFSLHEAGGYLLHDFPNFRRKSELGNTKKSCILHAAVKIHNIFIIATKYVVQNW